MVPESLPPRRPRRVKPAVFGLAVVGALWLWGLGSFVTASGNFEVTLPRRRPSPDRLHNFSLWDLGPTVRASSFYGDYGSLHHPAFMVDGLATPDKVQKWASAERDRHPWVELLWREKHDLERVVIHHAGAVEDKGLTANRYTLWCLTDQGHGPSLEVVSNQEPVASHDLACAQARGLRIEFVPKDSHDIIRVFEVETWGR